MKKECYRCTKKKSVSEFYKCKANADGFFGKCKECYKKDVKENYQRNREYYIEYEKKRWLRPDRRKKALEYQRKRRKRFPGKNRARQTVNNAIRDGRLLKKPCEVCGEKKVEAHHQDYRSPLKVQWLCREHHLAVEGKTAY